MPSRTGAKSQGLAPSLAGSDPVLCLQPGNPPGNPEIDQDAGPVPVRGCRRYTEFLTLLPAFPVRRS